MKNPISTLISPAGQDADRGLQGECRILATFARSVRTEARLTLSEFGGRKTIDLRLYYKNSVGEWSPSKKGTGVKLEELVDFLAALELVQQEVS